jgi:hypothetical protein
MQEQQTLHYNAETAGVHCNEKAAGATIQCRSSRCYTVMQNYKALHGNAEVAGAKLQCRSRFYKVMKK